MAVGNPPGCLASSVRRKSVARGTTTAHVVMSVLRKVIQDHRRTGETIARAHLDEARHPHASSDRRQQNDNRSSTSRASCWAHSMAQSVVATVLAVVITVGTLWIMRVPVAFPWCDARLLGARWCSQLCCPRCRRAREARAFRRLPHLPKSHQAPV